jgi:hypothetical protein
MLNTDSVDLDFEIPAPDTKKWLKVIDTGLSSPQDIVETEQASGVAGNVCRVTKHSVLVLVARNLHG